MLTKEKCEKALKTIEDGTNEIEDYEAIPRGYCNEFEQEIDLLKQLIKEHFDNPPLKFEELKENMWVWDDAKKRYLKIKGITSDCLGRAIVKYQNGYENDNHYYLTEFEKNRFYRKEVEE